MYHSPNIDDFFDDGTTLDIRFEGDSTTLIRHKHWTSAEIEQQVAQFGYSGEKLAKDPDVEKAKLPPFVLSFYKFIFFKSRLPDENELWNYYVGQHFIKVNETYLSFQKKDVQHTYLADAIRARMLRSYPSLIRDFHFFVLCQESQRFERVCYSLRKDYFEGVDLTVQYQNREFNVAVMLNSERARAYKTQKYNRHAESPINEIILLFDLYQHTQVKGQIKLFSTHHLDQLLIELNNRTSR